MTPIWSHHEATAVVFLSLLCFIGSAGGQGGTGRETPKPKSPTTPAKTTPEKQPAARNSPVVNLQGTIWAIEFLEGTQNVGQGVVEFLTEGRFRLDGELAKGGELGKVASWKQTGRRIALYISSEATMAGVITGNEIKGTWTGKDVHGKSHQMPWRAKRGDARLLAELNYWKSVQGSRNPEDYRNYLAKYPRGVYVDLAVRILKDLEEPKSSPTPSTPPPNSQRLRVWYFSAPENHMSIWSDA